MDLRAPPRNARSSARASAEGGLVRSADRCRLGRPDCPYRVACTREASSLTRARAGSLSHFDALYDRYFALVYRAASQRFRSRALAEACTRAVLEHAFLARAAGRRCTAVRLLLLVARLSARSNGHLLRTLT